ncbi:FKBP-type peptidyl-prolyl isomerase-like protein [Yokenella regensburgei]|uniref:FKBP-type peptidyl-prolyl isomerase-like protein n=2 Tax=Yokenella regensburgei TaxID=158877 RepID=A0ABX9S1E5_9ENTR|nr:FKBP-type peptidyl-prolyl isomerase-like protein [Yokenella regensburgei]VFS17870.1 FKBP-type peptidyl-prolyl cis-trans isomerase [Yokenella regensburgei]
MRLAGIVGGLIWVATAGTPLAAAPVADILRPESEISLNGLWSLAEEGPVAGNHPVARPKPAFQHPVSDRDVRPAHPRLQDKKRVDDNHGRAKASIPERVPVSRGPGRNGSVQIYRGAEKMRQLLARSRKVLLGFLALRPGETRPSIHGQADEVAYASGVMAGTAILQNEAVLALSGVKHDRALMLAGIRDVFLRQVRLRGRQLENAQQRAIVEVRRAGREAHEHQLASENRFVMDFRQRRGVHAGGEGVWYRVDQAGRRSGLTRHSVIPLVAREMLADGTVIRDMQAEKKILNAALGDLPIPWQKAIAQAGYGGAVTVVQKAAQDGSLPVRVTMIRTFDPRNYVFPLRHTSATE